MLTFLASFAALVAAVTLSVVRARPVALFAAFAIVFLGFGVIELIMPPRSLVTLGADQSLFDSNGHMTTNPFVVQGLPRRLFIGGLAWSVLTAIIYGLMWIGALYSKLTTATFWGMAIGSAGSNLLYHLWLVPQRSDRLIESFERTLRILWSFSILSLVSLALFLALSGWSVARYIITRRRAKLSNF